MRLSLGGGNSEADQKFKTCVTQCFHSDVCYYIFLLVVIIAVDLNWHSKLHIGIT